MPLGIGCGTGPAPEVERTFRMPRDRFLPVTIVLNDMVMISLDPQAGYRFRKPARMILSIYPRVFDSVEDQSRWFNERKFKIDQSYEYRRRRIEQSGPDCKFDAACNDEFEELDKKKAGWLQQLNRLKATTKIRPPGTKVKRPASVTIDEGGQKLCLVKANDGTWKSRPCAKNEGARKIRKITVNGKDECIVQVNSTTWEARPCP
jgi:hypothetical protein